MSVQLNAFLSMSNHASWTFDKCLCLCATSFNTLYFIVQHKNSRQHKKYEYEPWKCCSSIRSACQSQNSIRTVKLGGFWVWSENWVFLLCCRPTQTWDNSLWELFAAQYHPEWMYYCISVCGCVVQGEHLVHCLAWIYMWAGRLAKHLPTFNSFCFRHLCYCLKFYYMWYMTQSQML